MAVINSEKIDFIGHHPESDVVTSAIIEKREWDGSAAMRQQLEAKIPAIFGKLIEMRLFTSHLPDPETANFIEVVHSTLAEHQISFRVSKLNSSS